MEIGDGLINISSGGTQVQRDPANAWTASQTLKVYVDDLDTHFQRAKAAGATIISEPEDGFWGGRIYRATDLQGYPWEFSQRGVDLPAKDWRLPPGMTRGEQ